MYKYQAAPVEPVAAPKVTRPSITHRPEFTLADLEGEQRSITEWDGDALVINFWATWCPPCRREVPLLISLQNEYKDDNIQVVGIAVDYFDPVREYTTARNINYQVLVGDQDAIEAAEGFGVDFVGLPFTIFTDHTGRIIRRHTGELHREEAVAILETIRDLRAGRAGANDWQELLYNRLVDVADATGRPVAGGAR